VAAAVAAAVVVLAVGVALGLSWFSPEARFNRRVVAVQKLLQESRQIDLISAGADGQAMAVKWWGADATELHQTDEGLRIDTPLDASLIQLLPAVPGDRYTIRTEVRLDWSRNGRGGFGVYCRHAGVTTAAGNQHLLEGLFLSDDAKANQMRAVL
jgi:hypothetical protein